MAIKHKLQSSIYFVLKHNKDGSFATQANRKKMLYACGNELVNNGYKLQNIKSLKRKHIIFLVEQWKMRKLSIGTIKNRLANLRWLCEKLDKPNVIPTNDELNIGSREFITNKDKSIKLNNEQLNKITDKHIKLSLQLQYHFGLRREEVLKIKPFIADKTNFLELQGSWCKNGRSRKIPIITDEQKQILEQCRKLLQLKHLSMIPKNRNYKQHLKIYETQLSNAKIYHAHGLRHDYAQRRYFEITGKQCAVKNEINEHREIDKQARLKISEEMGHSRIQIVANYLGSNKKVKD